MSRGDLPACLPLLAAWWKKKRFPSFLFYPLPLLYWVPPACDLHIKLGWDVGDGCILAPDNVKWRSPLWVGQQDLRMLFFSSSNSSRRRRAHQSAASTSVAFLTSEGTRALSDSWFSSTAPGLNTQWYAMVQHLWVLFKKGWYRRIIRSSTFQESSKDPTQLICPNNTFWSWFISRTLVTSLVSEIFSKFCIVVVFQLKICPKVAHCHFIKSSSMPISTSATSIRSASPGYLRDGYKIEDTSYWKKRILIFPYMAAALLLLRE